MSGAFSGTLGLLFAFQGQYALAVAMVAPMLAFFVGEANGRKGGSA